MLDGSVPDFLFSSSVYSFVGTTRTFTEALLTRFFLGFVEAVFFPGSICLLSKWYKRSELGLRVALLTCGNLINNAFGLLMASSILGGTEGKLGHAAWYVTFARVAYACESVCYGRPFLTGGCFILKVA